MEEKEREKKQTSRSCLYTLEQFDIRKLGQVVDDPSEPLRSILISNLCSPCWTIRTYVCMLTGFH